MKQKIITHSVIASIFSLAVVGCGGSGGSGGNVDEGNQTKINVSKDKENATLANTFKRLSTTVAPQDTLGNPVDTGETEVHPLLVTYLQQVTGDYETGDGSADIGDPTHVDGVFAALSLDNGATWRNFKVSDTSDKSSVQVEWAGSTINYPGHAQRPTFASHKHSVSGKEYIVVAWNDKYCPSGDPLNLGEGGGTGNYPDDYFGVNGKQGYVDYDSEDESLGDGFEAPNGKIVYQVPFSCVWTARAVYDPETKEAKWYQPMQLTTGVRDSNKIWIEASDSGFAMTWQEDPEGLRAGKGEGPGDGWSGATTNHGADIWYSALKWDEFEEDNGTGTNTSGDNEPILIAANNFHYPVRITDNQKCQESSKSQYCVDLCAKYGDPDGDGSCNTSDFDMLENNNTDIDPNNDYTVTLNGDTGASRPALKILNDGTKDIVILGYEETKGLSSGQDKIPDNLGTVPSDIALEGKSVYFESFSFNSFFDFNNSDFNISAVDRGVDDLNRIPLVSAGNIVNLKSEYNGVSFYENARRLVIGTQVDPSDEHDYNFAFLYKQGVETTGGSADMFVRVNKGYTYEDFIALPDANLSVALDATNVSAEEFQDVNASSYEVKWSSENLRANSFDNLAENSFSPRIFLRGYDIYVGYVYTPDDNASGQENMPINFHTNVYTNGEWEGPENVSNITKAHVTVVDPRFVPTPKGADTGLASDESNTSVMFVTWGTVEGRGEERGEGNIYYKRAVQDENGTWIWDENQSTLAGLTGDNPTEIEEEQVQTLASPDGSMLFNVWIQEADHDVYLLNQNDRDYGLDTWFRRVDFE